MEQEGLANDLNAVHTHPLTFALSMWLAGAEHVTAYVSDRRDEGADGGDGH